MDDNGTVTIAVTGVLALLWSGGDGGGFTYIDLDFSD